MPPELLILCLVVAIVIPIAILVVVVLRAMNDWQPVGTGDLWPRRWSRLRTVRIGDVVRLLWKTVVCALVVLLLLASLAGSIAAVVIVFVLILVSQRYRMARQQAMLSTLAVAAERGIPLPSALRALVAERRGGAARKTRKVADYLEGGATLADAMASAGRLVPRQAMLKIRIGQDVGSLPQALRGTEQTDVAVDSVRAQLGAKLMYLGLVAWFGMGVFVFVAWKIIPSFEKIFKDFGTQLPAVTRLFVAVCRVTLDFWPLWILPLFLVLLYLLAFAIAGFEANFPILRGLTRRLDTAAILEALALVIERQRPMTQGILTLAMHYPKRTVRRRLDRAFAAIHAGADWIDSLLAQRLIRPADAAVLRAAERAGNLPWALREVAEGNRRRFNYRVYVLLQWLFPLVILLVGLTVALFVAACFTPLVTLIQKLTG
jgi:type II secretory pathway component PulF